jgi:predicted dehydrogenase
VAAICGICCRSLYGGFECSLTKITMVNVLFVGCGAVLEHLYCKPLRKLERSGWVRVCGVVDPLEHRREAASQWFREASAFGGLEDAFAALRKVDLTIVATPPACHSSQVVMALHNHSHVLCEKPMAHSAAAAEEMVDAARKQKRILAIGMARRFYPSIAVARVLIREGVLGANLTFAYRESSTFDWPLASPALFHRETNGGGMLIDIGIHALDLLFFLFGPGRVVRSADDAVGKNTVEISALVELVFGSNTGCLQLSWESPLNNGLLISGPKAELWLPLSPIQAVWKRNTPGAGGWERLLPTASWPSGPDGSCPKPSRPRNFGECIWFQLVSVLRSILLGEPPMATGKEGLEVLRLVMAAYAQAAPLQKPWLPPAEGVANAAQHWRTFSG